MKKTVLFGLFILGAFILQRIFAEHMPLFGSGPDFVLVILVYFALYHDPLKGVVLAFVLGYMTDMIIGFHPGLNATIYTILLVTTFQMGKNFYLRSIAPQLLAAALITIGYATAEFLLLWAFEIPVEVRLAIWFSLPGKLILNTACAPIIFRILWMIEDISTPSLLRSGGRLGFT